MTDRAFVQVLDALVTARKERDALDAERAASDEFSYRNTWLRNARRALAAESSLATATARVAEVEAERDDARRHWDAWESVARERHAKIERMAPVVEAACGWNAAVAPPVACDRAVRKLAAAVEAYEVTHSKVIP